MITSYKVCRLREGYYYSAIKHLNKWDLPYVLNKRTTPSEGAVFAFENVDDALAYQKTLQGKRVTLSDYVTLKGKGELYTNVPYPAWRIFPTTWTHFQSFWDHFPAINTTLCDWGQRYEHRMYVPIGTVLLKWFTPKMVLT